MRLRSFATEQDLAKVVIPWLADQDFEVYQEVQVYHDGRRADLVGRRGSTIIVIECKLNFGERVICQAWSWLVECNMALVAVPALGTKGHGGLVHLCKTLGIGALEVQRGYDYLTHQDPPRVSESIPPAIRRTRNSALASVLCDGHKTTCPAGSASGGHWTPFRETCRQIVAYVREMPGATLKQTIDGVKHHYHTAASARGSMRKWIEAGRVEGLRSEVEGGKVRLYLSAAQREPGGAGEGR